jgi:TRAP-type C4-dicarboxylate transport system permease small subunit
LCTFLSFKEFLPSGLKLFLPFAVESGSNIKVWSRKAVNVLLQVSFTLISLYVVKKFITDACQDNCDGQSRFQREQDLVEWEVSLYSINFFQF